VYAPTKWLSGSGETHIISAPFLANRACAEQQVAVRWNLPGWRAIIHATRNR